MGTPWGYVHLERDEATGDYSLIEFCEVADSEALTKDQVRDEERRDTRGGPRIVVAYGEGLPWRCLLCGAAVFHVDDHYEWHLRIDGSPDR